MFDLDIAAARTGNPEWAAALLDAATSVSEADHTTGVAAAVSGQTAAQRGR